MSWISRPLALLGQSPRVLVSQVPRHPVGQDPQCHLRGPCRRTVTTQGETHTVFDKHTKLLQRERSAGREDAHLYDYLKDEVNFSITKYHVHHFMWYTLTTLCSTHYTCVLIRSQRVNMHFKVTFFLEESKICCIISECSFSKARVVLLLKESTVNTVN